MKYFGLLFKRIADLYIFSCGEVLFLMDTIVKQSFVIPVSAQLNRKPVTTNRGGGGNRNGGK